MDLEKLLGYGYVIPWSISAYPPVYHNWRRNSAAAMSLDFVMMNIVGYFYLLCSLSLQLFCWLEGSQDSGNVSRPKVTNFDFWYCLHGFILNLVVLSQVVWGARIWNFQKGSTSRMKPIYGRILAFSLAVCMASTVQIMWQQAHHGWNNADTLAFCNKLYLLKISMSLIKYIPQVKHNFERKSMKGFPIQSVVCDVFGSVCSLSQLALQIARDEPILTVEVVSANFGRIGIALVTLFFNFVYISQWLLYGE
ncbi:LANO_0A01376g1_1 [Lachancea nothofagi CBS 11611]|uniref:LANO_0A01376g1_1 n=1 Tax=Lachancea nothofagi CBS 11611 TaxID=1266666 RepID=A0A1G4IMK1_9SACH|nr:LANO_0A01376g1_1 [Lachancea nothofagi CBS 11611]